MNTFRSILMVFAISSVALAADGPTLKTHLSTIGDGWSRTSVNAVVFRHNSVVSHGNEQYAAYYDDDANMVLAKRKLGTDAWEVHKTQYKGNARDAHNTICIALDGDGFLHVSWDHHGGALRYARSTKPGGLVLTDKLSMTGVKENRVTYPEFYLMANGDLLFLYRDGGSGRGDLMMNRYVVKEKKWVLVQDAFINGEEERNAYWQMTVGQRGAIHLSWVWRETGDVSTNHDICYARSNDGGKTWEKSTGEVYTLPITEKTAEYAVRIPQGSTLINTASMCTDSEGRPYIATYWRPEGTGVPQYHLVYSDGATWHVSQVSQRTTPFRFGGGGTRAIPVSRPQIVADTSGKTDKAYMLFRDVERGGRVSVAICNDLSVGKWRFADLTDFSVSAWEPSYDKVRWNESKELHVYVQTVEQLNADKALETPPTPVFILEWKPGE